MPLRIDPLLRVWVDGPSRWRRSYRPSEESRDSVGRSSCSCARPYCVSLRRGRLIWETAHTGGSIFLLQLRDQLDDSLALSATETLHASVLRDAELAHDVIGLRLADAGDAHQELVDADALGAVIIEGVGKGKLPFPHEVLELHALAASLCGTLKRGLALLVGHLGQVVVLHLDTPHSPAKPVCLFSDAALRNRQRRFEMDFIERLMIGESSLSGILWMRTNLSSSSVHLRRSYLKAVCA
ncbi:hypothetical protein QSI_2908 [Clostridioides difficile P28]|nr:hypothetical protein QSI_2908 [Clostridioides difficile P28]